MKLTNVPWTLNISFTIPELYDNKININYKQQYIKNNFIQRPTLSHVLSFLILQGTNVYLNDNDKYNNLINFTWNDLSPFSLDKIRRTTLVFCHFRVPSNSPFSQLATDVLQRCNDLIVHDTIYNKSEI